MKYISFFILSFLFFSSALYGEKIHSFHLRTNEGMHQSTIYSIYQDEFGLMWFGTKNGLYNYDGNRTQHIDKIYKDVPFAEELIRKVCGDKKGKLYLDTRTGIIEYDIRSDAFRRIIPAANCIYYGKNTLWVCIRNTIYQWKNDSLTTYFSLPDKKASIDCMLETPHGDLYTGTREHGIYRIEKDLTVKNLLPEVRQIRQLLQDSEQIVWVATRRGGLYKIDRKNCIVNYRHQPEATDCISSNIIRSLCEDNSGNLWIATFNGLNKYIREEDKFVPFEFINENAYTLNDESIYCLTKDSQGSIWIGSFFGEINFFHPEYEAFSYHFAGENKQLAQNVIFGETVEDKDGNLWICAERGGIFRYNPQLRKLTPFSQENGISYNVQTLYLDKEKNNLWIGTLLEGLKRLDLRTHQLVSFQKNTLINNSIRKIIPYKNNLILATHTGVGLFDRVTHQCINLTSGNPTLKDKAVTTLLLDRKERLWIAAGNDLFRYGLSDKKWENIRINSDSLACENVVVNKIYENSNGDIWIATSRHGLYVQRKGETVFTCINKQKGLIDNSVIDMAEDNRGNMLIVTGNGLSYLKSENDIVNISRNKFISFFNFTANSMFIDSHNRVFLGGINILCEFPVEKIFTRPQDYSVNLSELYIDGEKVMTGKKEKILPQSLLYAGKITFPAQTGSFCLHAFTTNYAPALKCGIRYKLEPLDKDWKQANSLNEITYTNLSPGKYTLLMQGDTKLPSGNYPERTLDIVIKAPFYRTPLAYILYVLVVMFLLYEGYQVLMLRSSLKLEKAQKKQIEELNQIKLRFFTNISHEFKTPLTLIFNQVELMLQSKGLPPKLYNRLLSIWKNTTRMNKLIAELLEFRKQEQGFLPLRVSYGNLIALINDICLSFKDYAHSRKITLNIIMQEEEIGFYFDKQQIEKAIFNLLSNAFKFTPAEGSITVSVRKGENRAYIDIADTGTGINQEELDKIFLRFYQTENVSYTHKSGTGIGLAFTKNIVEAHKGAITVKSRKGIGSCFTVELPLDVAYDVSCIKEEVPFIEKDIQTKPENTVNTDFINEQIEEQEKAQTRNSRILIVEDNEEVRTLLVNVFEPLYRVETAGNGKEGYEKVLAFLPDIIVSDVVMPEMSGTELCRKVKTNIETSHIPVVLLTSQAASEYVMEGLKIGADDYITKPFSIKQLIVRCNNLVNSRKVLQQKFTRQTDTSSELIATTSLDQEIIENSIRLIRDNLTNPVFTIDFLAQQLGIGRTKYFSKIKAITGLTPNEFITNTKLKFAFEMLREHPDISMNELAFQLGFSSTSHFIKLFKEFSGMTPTQYKQKKIQGK